MLETSLVRKTIVGRNAASPAAVLEISYDAAVLSVDELIQAPDVADFVSPGFIDLQVNGFAGADYNDPSSSHEAIAQSIRTMFETGVTRFFPTLITGSEERIVRALRNLVAARKSFAAEGRPEADAMAGIHVEGPHLSPEDGPRGAHPLEHVRPPDSEEFRRWQEAAQGEIRLVTVSPEWVDTPAYVKTLVRAGVVASIGHTKANTDQIRAAVDAGATMSTHLGNAAHPILPKTQSYIWDQLAEDRLVASFIVDGIHIPAGFLKTALRAKGLERAVLVTDAVMPAMCDVGFYTLGQVEVELRANGSVVITGTERLAGSALRMDRAIGNSVRLAGVSLHEALTMATVNAARAGRVAGRLRGLATGEKADFVRFQWDPRSSILQVKETIVAGVSAYRA
jgi:N-acetylglucosamine-6-phosphate deacetylase